MFILRTAHPDLTYTIMCRVVTGHARTHTHINMHAHMHKHTYAYTIKL